MVLVRSLVSRAVAVRALLAAMAVCGIMVGPAHARIFIGLGVPLFFPPVVVPPPVYYPPYYAPNYYPPSGTSFNYTPPSTAPQSLAPPRGYYGPGGYTESGGYTPSMGGVSPPDGGAQSCRAGAYVCPLVQDTPPGGACSCPGHEGRRIRGTAD